MLVPRVQYHQSGDSVTHGPVTKAFPTSSYKCNRPDPRPRQGVKKYRMELLPIIFYHNLVICVLTRTFYDEKSNSTYCVSYSGSNRRRNSSNIRNTECTCGT